MIEADQIRFGRGVLDGSECVSTAWELLKRHYGLYLGACLLTMLLSSWLYCASWIVYGPVFAGLYLIVSKDLSDEPIEFGMLFKGFEKFLPLMIIGLVEILPQILYGILSLLINFVSLLIPQPRHGEVNFAESGNPFPFAITGAMVLIFVIVFIVIMLFWIAWSTTFLFVIPLTFEYDLKPLEAIKVSARAAWANFGALVVLNIMLFLVGLLGMLMICVGIFLVSIPVTLIAHAVVYRRIFPRMQEEFRNMMPPPPNTYGDFGAGMPAA
jgi:hypothetical protein